MVHVKDLTKLPLSDLTNQEISSRMHLLSDEIVRQHRELLENQRILAALSREYDWRISNG